MPAMPPCVPEGNLPGGQPCIVAATATRPLKQRLGVKSPAHCTISLARISAPIIDYNLGGALLLWLRHQLQINTDPAESRRLSRFTYIREKESHKNPVQ